MDRNLMPEGGIAMEVKTLTILDLFETVQDIAASDEEVVAVLDHMMRKGIVVRGRPAEQLPAQAA
jgi:hypothetical protein